MLMLRFKQKVCADFTIDDLECISRAKILERNRLKDKAIVKRNLRIKDKNMVNDIVINYIHVIDLKRNELLTRKKLKDAAKIK